MADPVAVATAPAPRPTVLAADAPAAQPAAQPAANAPDEAWRETRENADASPAPATRREPGPSFPTSAGVPLAAVEAPRGAEHVATAPMPPLAAPRPIDPSRLLTTLPPAPPSPFASLWWRVAAIATSAAFVALFGIVALLPDRPALRVTSHAFPLVSLPEAPGQDGTPSLTDQATDNHDKTETTDRDEDGPEPITGDDEDASAVTRQGDSGDQDNAIDSPRVAAAVPAPPRATPSPAPRRQPAASRRAARFTPRNPRPSRRGGFMAAIAERKRTMGYIVARSTQTCVFLVNGVPRGSGRQFRVAVPPGAHRVSCRTASDLQTQTVEVRSRRATGAQFAPDPRRG